MGEAEALTALAGLRHANPDWSFPRLVPGASALEAEELGHPLLPPDVCVTNDVEVGPPGRFLLVTGSNMSGKSTLLRALGLNAVLAQAGAPVCARSLTLPPLRVCTSMRVDDSLRGGVSFFMAELRRLKHVVDVAEAGDEATTLYLLDEILQGTNTAERRVAARTVIRRLLASGAMGAVTTHDLTLADADDLMEAAVPVHFTETVGSPAEGLSFDYRLRPGIARSTNALKLLRLVGLGGDG
jgi:DNA mismatch repair ATPase MutS